MAYMLNGLTLVRLGFIKIVVDSITKGHYNRPINTTKELNIMAYNYSKADDAALASAWFPEATRPFTYQVKRSNMFGAGYLVVKAIEGSYDVGLSHDTGLTQEQAQELLSQALATDDVEGFFKARSDEYYAAGRAAYAAEQKRRADEAAEYLRTRKPLTWIIDEIEEANK
jgi:hypothetical protein